MNAKEPEHEVKTILDLLEYAETHSASDIIVTSNETPAVKIAGALRPFPSKGPLREDQVRRVALALLGEENYNKFEKQGQVDVAYQIPDKGRLRIHAFSHIRGTAITLRLIPERVWPFEQLGLPRVLKDIAVNKTRGLFLSVGPTGSGKTTTIAAMIDHLGHNRAAHIITIEDPVEFLFPPPNDPKWRAVIHQREVSSRGSNEFVQAVWAAMRQIPDVIVIGEIRDRETMRAALHAADSGHLVLGSMHANGAPEAIERIVSMFPGSDAEQVRYQLSLNLAGIIYQVLVPTDRPWRQLAYELLLPTTAVSTQIREGKTAQLSGIMSQGARDGMKVLEQTLAELVRSGRIGADQARRYARDSELYNNYLMG